MMGEGAWCYYRYKRDAVGKLGPGGCGRDQQRLSQITVLFVFGKEKPSIPSGLEPGGRSRRAEGGGWRLRGTTLGAAAAKC